MPEGHTIHRLARDQKQSIAGQTLRITSPQGRFRAGARRISCSRLRRVEAAGKHLFYHFENAPILHVHLGLFGKFRTYDNPPPPPRGAVRVRFIGDSKTVDLNGPNTCELIDRDAYQSILDRLGPDPLRANAKPARAWQRIHKSRQSIGLLLMDQSVIAGIGNIYRSEMLHLLNIHPRTSGEQITRPQFNKLWKLAVQLLELGVKHNRIITIDLKTLKKSIEKTPRKKLFRIFKYANCPTCARPIERFVLGGRKVFACPICQPGANCGPDIKVKQPGAARMKPSHRSPATRRSSGSRRPREARS